MCVWFKKKGLSYLKRCYSGSTADKRKRIQSDKRITASLWRRKMEFCDGASPKKRGAAGEVKENRNFIWSGWGSTECRSQIKRKETEAAFYIGFLCLQCRKCAGWHRGRSSDSVVSCKGKTGWRTDHTEAGRMERRKADWDSGRRNLVSVCKTDRCLWKCQISSGRKSCDRPYITGDCHTGDAAESDFAFWL